MNWSDPEFAEIAALLTAEFGVAFPPARRAFSEAAMRRALAHARERSLTAYRRRLAGEPALLRALIAEVTVGETYFFRDSAQFDFIRTTVLPAAALRSGSEPIRIWSAGCSTGEEAYSLAIVLAESGLRERSKLVATDVSANAIETARRGHYGPWSFRHDAGAWRERCFTRAGTRWSVGAPYRNVDFHVHNLMHPAPAHLAGAGFDLILCRNVLLYFDAQTVARAAQLLANALAPGGWLLASPTDPPIPAESGLESVVTGGGIVYRRPVKRAADAPAAFDGAPVPPFAAAAPAAPPAPPAAVAPETLEAQGYVALALDLLDASQPRQAVAQARRALFLDRSLAVAHLTLARALRLSGSRAAAGRALRRGAALLEAQAPDDEVPGSGGVSAGTLCAVAAAELDLLVGSPT